MFLASFSSYYSAFLDAFFNDVKKLKKIEKSKKDKIKKNLKN